MSGCNELTACGMCLWDATIVQAEHEVDLECHWCQTTQRCESGIEALTCPQLISGNASHTACPELGCHLAPVSFNVYACRPEVLAAFWVHVSIFAVCMVAVLWVRALSQKPWTVPGLQATARRSWARAAVTPSVHGQDSSDLGEALDVEERELQGTYTEVFAGSGAWGEGARGSTKSCPHCADAEGECGWCRLSRIAFLPVLICTTTVTSNMLVILLFSLRSSFFRLYLLLTAVMTGLCLLWFHYTYVRAATATNRPAWDPYYLRLSLLLRGRAIRAVFARHSGDGGPDDDEAGAGGAASDRKGSIAYLTQMPSFFGDMYSGLSSMVYGSGFGTPKRGAGGGDAGKNAAGHHAHGAGAGGSAARDHDRPGVWEEGEALPPDVTVTARVSLANEDSAATSPSTAPGPSSSVPAAQQASSSSSTSSSSSSAAASSSSNAFARRTEAAGMRPHPLRPGNDRMRQSSLGGNLIQDSRHLVYAEQADRMLRRSGDCGVPLLVEKDDDPLLGVVDGVSPVFQQALLSGLNNEVGVEDERVVWCEVPSVRKLLIHDMIFLHICATVMFSSGLFFSLATGPDLKVYKIIGPARLHIVGVLVVIVPLVLLAFHVASCRRVYVMTTHNVVTLYHSCFGVTRCAQPNFDINCGLVSVYEEFGIVLTAFSWRQPGGSRRKMPALPFSQFQCVADVGLLLSKVEAFCPPFSAAVWRNQTEERAMEWRLHMALTYGALLMCCTTFHYTHAVPMKVLALGFLTCFSLTVAVFAKGLRHHFTFNKAVDTASQKKDSIWHQERWQAKRVEEENEGLPSTEAVLDSLAKRRGE
eukprot:Rhum_TRINITY_DN15766_c0_g1::Rhum_TRINITY_DN15766_c0_g1_i1::g.162069::m.162069